MSWPRKAGTDVARQSADLVLADENFATVTTAVRGGRVLFANLRKAVRYYLAAKVALVTSSLVAVLAGLPVPFEPVQIIVIELFMDLGASATLVIEPLEEDVMRRPARDPRRPLRDREMQLGILFGGLSLGAAVLRALSVGVAGWPSQPVPDHGLRRVDDRRHRAGSAHAVRAPATPAHQCVRQSSVPDLGRR